MSVGKKSTVVLDLLMLNSLVRVYDCRSESCRSWDVGSEVERVLWDHFNPFCLLASTESGLVFYIDARQEKPVWQLNAHSKACTGMSLSHQCPGLLVTASQDKMFKVTLSSFPFYLTLSNSNLNLFFFFFLEKVWDVQSSSPSFVAEHEFKLGGYYCAAACPDAAFAFCLGADNKSDNFKVWDVRQSAAGKSQLPSSRLLVQSWSGLGDCNCLIVDLSSEPI